MIGAIIALVVISGTLGDLLNSLGMKRHGEILDWSAASMLLTVRELATNWYILASLPAMAISFFALLSLLSVSTLSFAVPMTASSYILETALAKYLLKEKVDWHRWVGASLVAIGVALLSF